MKTKQTTGFFHGASVFVLPIADDKVPSADSTEYEPIYDSKPFVSNIPEQNNTFCLCTIYESEDFLVIKVDKRTQKTADEYMQAVCPKEVAKPNYLRLDSILTCVKWLETPPRTLSQTQTITLEMALKLL